MRITPLSWSDYQRAYDLMDKTFDSSELSCFKTAWKTRHPTASFKFVEQGAVLGFILVSQTNHIQYIAVDPDFQGQSIGSKLLTRALHALDGARAVWLKTADDRRLRGWYERYGFTHYYCYTCAITKEWIGDCMVRRNSRSAEKN